MPEAWAGQRQDRILAQLLPQHSRARLQEWIRDGRVLVAGRTLAPKIALSAGTELTVRPPRLEASQAPRAQAMDLDIRYEDEHILVVSKPAGLTVHPGAGQADGTLLNALLAHRASLDAVPRAGIIHRLDKDTSGLLVIAATVEAQTALTRALEARDIGREYRAIVWGVPVAGGTIDAPLGRHVRERTRFMVKTNGRHAITHYRVAEKLPRHALLAVELDTGRTHQIRVHMQHAGYPLVGDPAYGRRGDPYRAVLKRQALHASRLSLPHPASGETMQWEQALPQDMQDMLEQLRELAPA